MKKFLSLVLALAMTLSLVTISAGAKDFADSDELSGEQYEEAVNVMSEMGIIDGYASGDFQPQGTLTRGAAAKIIACMMLGKTTAEALGTQAAPFKDVPAGSTFAGYIAYCVESGLIDGYADGTFRPGNTLTGFAFLKMLLTALGYDSSIEGFTGTNWTVNVASRAIEAGLTKGNEDFVGTKAATREEACLYAVNALRATLVEYESKGTNVSVNGATVAIGASKPTYVTSNIHDAATSINDATDNVKNGWTVEFGEKYQPDLALKDTVDAFGRPAHTWTWKKAEIGTYVDFDKMVAEYTTKVTGEDLYDLLGKTAIEDNEVLVYVDGEDGGIGDAAFSAADLNKKNDETVGETGNGVLTQVFLDTAEDEITIAVINTYLAIAEEDYDEKNEDVDLTVYHVDEISKSYVKADDEKVTMTVEAEDFDIDEVAEDDMFLVTIADGAIQTMAAPEVLSETEITNFGLKKYVTADGEKYDYADTVMYDEEVLDQYDDSNMKDLTYNVILDPYGYMIGIELNQDPDQYVFLTGLDGKYSNLSVREADANVIFLDGNMEKVTVNMVKSDLDTVTSGKNLSQINAWCTYTVTDAGVYTLKEVAVSGATSAIDKDKDIDVAQYAQDVAVAHDSGAATKTISQKYVSLKAADSSTYVYGNDDSVYINVELEDVRVEDNNHGTNLRWIVDDVESVTVGVKNTNLVVSNLLNVGGYEAPAAEIYTLYDDDGYVIAAVTMGENEGTATNYVYVTSSNVNREALNDNGNWTWTREVFVEGEVKELTEVGTSLDVLDTMKQGEWYEVRYDANGNVRKAEAIDFSVAGDKYASTVTEAASVVRSFETVVLSDTGNRDGAISTAADINALVFQNGTLYTAQLPTEKGFAVSPDAKILLALAGKTPADEFDDVDVYTGYNGLEKALRDMNATAAGFTAGSVEVSAILENGVATSIVINDKNAKGGFTPDTPATDYTPVVTQKGTFLEIQANTNDGDDMIVYTAAWNWLVNNGYSVVSAQDHDTGVDPTDYWTFFVSKNGQSTFFNTQLISMVEFTLDGKTEFMPVGTKISSTTAGETTLVSGGDYWWYSKGATPAFGHTDNGNASTNSGDVQRFNDNDYTLSYSAHNGKLTIITGLYEVTVDSDGAGSGSNTDYYYQMGDSMDDELSGNWYALGTAPAAATATSTTGVKMSNALKNQTIWDNYYHITSGIGGSGVVSDQYVLGSGTSACVGNVSFRFAKDADGSYVLLNGSAQIANPTRDYNIVDDGYALVNQNVTVNATGATGLNGMEVRATVAPGTYVKENGTFTVKLELYANNKTASSAVTVTSASLQGSNGTATETVVGAPVTIIAAGTNQLRIAEVTVEMSAAAPNSTGTLTIVLG